MKRFSLALASLLLLSACDDDSDSQAKTPPVTGYSAYIQANLSSNEDTAIIGASIYKDGRKITLVAGDVIAVSNGSQQKLLQGKTNKAGFYTGILNVDDVALPVDFIIKHEPVETRNDRWYPADLAYVDPGPGPFVGLNWSIEFPLPVSITTPTDQPTPAVYNYAEDLVIIQWTSDSSNVDNVRVKAHLQCLNETVEIYSGADTGETSLTMAEIFAKSSHSTETPFEELEEFAEDIIEIMLDPFDSITDDIIHADEFIEQCDINLLVFAEHKNQIGEPFVAGSVVASQSDNVQIYFNPFMPLEL